MTRRMRLAAPARTGWLGLAAACAVAVAWSLLLGLALSRWELPRGVVLVTSWAGFGVAVTAGSALALARSATLYPYPAERVTLSFLALSLVLDLVEGRPFNPAPLLGRVVLALGAMALGVVWVRARRARHRGLRFVGRQRRRATYI